MKLKYDNHTQAPAEGMHAWLIGTQDPGEAMMCHLLAGLTKNNLFLVSLMMDEEWMWDPQDLYDEDDLEDWEDEYSHAYDAWEQELESPLHDDWAIGEDIEIRW